MHTWVYVSKYSLTILAHSYMTLYSDSRTCIRSYTLFEYDQVIISATTVMSITDNRIYVSVSQHAWFKAFSNYISPLLYEGSDSI